jgi:two-component sensor histidine kinase
MQSKAPRSAPTSTYATNPRHHGAVREYDGAPNVPVTVILRQYWSLDPERAGKAWQYYLATAFYNTVIAIILTIFFSSGNSRAPIWDTFLETLVISQCIGFCIHVMFDCFHRFTKYEWRQSLPRGVLTALHFAFPIAGVFVGYGLAFALKGQNFFRLLVSYPRAGALILLVGLLAAFISYLVMDGQTRRLRSEADEARSKAEATALQKQASDAELRALQAQIEPHFLFNTLANVQALIDYEPTKARQMLESFIEYLRATLDASRRTRGTLGDEVAMLQRYLQLMQVRMGQRLHTVWDIEPGLLSQPLAPLLLQPLVENAIKYGLEPKIEGGTITIRASRQGHRIRVVVQDDGVGTHQASTARKPAPNGSGTGLKNVLARLQSTRGESATLVLADAPQGCQAILEFDAQDSAPTTQDTPA